MAKTRALIIGVSEHTTIQAKNLSFCKNDIYAVKHSFIQGLKVDQSDIILCGSNGTVICSEIINALRHLSDSELNYFSSKITNQTTHLKVTHHFPKTYPPISLTVTQ